MKDNNLSQELKIIIDEEIQEYANKIKKLKRQQRNDCGVKRPSYSMSLPKQYRSYIMSANKRGITFNLTVEEFEAITSQNCTYCGTNARIGVDRTNSKEGYTIENAQPCCTMCNLMKFTHDSHVFINHIKRISKHLNSVNEQNYE